jgi:hypothetical protein
VWYSHSEVSSSSSARTAKALWVVLARVRCAIGSSLAAVHRRPVLIGIVVQPSLGWGGVGFRAATPGGDAVSRVATPGGAASGRVTTPGGGAPGGGGVTNGDCCGSGGGVTVALL